MRFCVAIGLVFIQVTLMAQSRHLERADAYFEIFQYANAAKYYELALRKDSTLKTLERLSVCYQRLNLPFKSELVLKRLTQKYPDDFSFHIKYIKQLKFNGKLEVIGSSLDSLTRRFPNQLEFCANEKTWLDTVQTWIAKAPMIDVQNIKKINTEYAEISPFLFNNQLIFSTNRENILIKSKSDFDGFPHFDLYSSSLDSSIGDFSYPIIYSSIINSEKDETGASLTSDGNKIYFVQNVTNVSSEGDSVSRPKLFSAEWDKTKWGKPKTFILNNLPHSYAHPFVEGKEKMFLFSSDMPGGYGGSDIYVSINIDEKWTDPINLGPNINTPGNEVYPFLDSDNTLYFSSDYHLGLGGYDIFKSEQVNGDFDKAQNLKPPFNSHQNDFAFSINHSKGIGFFSSDRLGGKGKEDIYIFNLIKPFRIEAKGK